jgi:hypothetical protein
VSTLAVAGTRPYEEFTEAALKRRVTQLVWESEHADGERLDELLSDIAALRDELIERLLARQDRER